MEEGSRSTGGGEGGGKRPLCRSFQTSATMSTKIDFFLLAEKIMARVMRKLA